MIQPLFPRHLGHADASLVVKVIQVALLPFDFGLGKNFSLFLVGLSFSFHVDSGNIPFLVNIVEPAILALNSGLYNYASHFLTSFVLLPRDRDDEEYFFTT